MSKLQQFIENINKTKFSGIIIENESLSDWTTMKVGGSAKIFVEPKNENSMLAVMCEIFRLKLNYYILGGGSNVVFSDKGFNGVVVSTLGLKKISYIENSDKSVSITCGGGVTISQLMKFCEKNGITGLEKFSGLPGTVGGGTFMNARCYDIEFSDIVEKVQFFEMNTLRDDIFSNQKINVERSLKMYHNITRGNDWSYKMSPFNGMELIICRVVLKAKKAAKNKIQNIAIENERFVEDRREKGHFKYPSSGSVFKNNRDIGIPTGKLIDDAGLKGSKIGDAQIASWHGNFIINLGKAKADDIKKLVKLTQDAVIKKTGFFIEPEIIFI